MCPKALFWSVQDNDDVVEVAEELESYQSYLILSMGGSSL